jgi:hypothetical protein
MNIYGARGSGSNSSPVFSSLALNCRLHKTFEQWMRVRCPGMELGMELSGDKPGMVGKLDDLDKIVCGTDTAENHSFL